MSAHEAAPDPVLATLAGRGSGIRNVRYRANRTVLLSVSRDGQTLNSHECFRAAPRGVLDAIATFLTARRGSAEQRRALDVIRGWEGAERALEEARRAPRRPPPRSGPGAGVLRDLFDGYNRDRFGGRLPSMPLRVSGRMTRVLGTISYEEVEGRRRVRGIAISADLLLVGNEAVLRDTLLHEMAHAEAWLEVGHRGHGRVWWAVAERVGCVPRAMSGERVRGR
jgi:hypothetical protein